MSVVCVYMLNTLNTYEYLTYVRYTTDISISILFLNYKLVYVLITQHHKAHVVVEW